MKRVLLILISLSFFLAPCYALNPVERALVEHVGEVNKRQRVELDDVKAKLVWTHKELNDTQPRIDQLGQERDKYKNLYESDHEKMLKQASHILRLYITLGLLGVAIGVYLFLKFYVHLPI